MQGLCRDPEDSAIVAAIVSLAHALRLTAVAEGVETAEQLEQLRALGCDLAQGNYLASARPPEALDYAVASGV
jgi:EAL domain-containing protein (putative c-di-GMP-specific phosphodiesterase class I)